MTERVDLEALPPIERDEAFDRTYIPLPGGYEVQTKGRGSTYRIANTRDDQRFAVSDPHFHDNITKMAIAIRAEHEKLLAELRRLRGMEADAERWKTLRTLTLAPVGSEPPRLIVAEDLGEGSHCVLIGGALTAAIDAARKAECAVRSCTFDNPYTYQRECWQDGELLCSYSHKLLCEPGQIPGRYLFFGANIGPWNAGQLRGDREAMTKQDAARATGREG